MDVYVVAVSAAVHVAAIRMSRPKMRSAPVPARRAMTQASPHHMAEGRAQAVRECRSDAMSKAVTKRAADAVAEAADAVTKTADAMTQVANVAGA